jgi:hypothetical protein
MPQKCRVAFFSASEQMPVARMTTSDPHQAVQSLNSKRYSTSLFDCVVLVEQTAAGPKITQFLVDGTFSMMCQTLEEIENPVFQCQILLKKGFDKKHVFRFQKSCE